MKNFSVFRFKSQVQCFSMQAVMTTALTPMQKNVKIANSDTLQFRKMTSPIRSRGYSNNQLNS